MLASYPSGCLLVFWQRQDVQRPLDVGDRDVEFLASSNTWMRLFFKSDSPIYAQNAYAGVIPRV